MGFAPESKGALEYRRRGGTAVPDASHFDVGAADVPPEDRIRRTVQICNIPVLSPNFSEGISSLSSIANRRLDIVVSGAFRM
jgi:hypothetical protein